MVSIKFSKAWLPLMAVLICSSLCISRAMISSTDLMYLSAPLNGLEPIHRLEHDGRVMFGYRVSSVGHLVTQMTQSMFTDANANMNMNAREQKLNPTPGSGRRLTSSCLRVGTKRIEPFVFIQETLTDGVPSSAFPFQINTTEWSGYSADVFNSMVNHFPESEQCYTLWLFETNQAGLDAVQNHTIDVFAAGTTITAARLAHIDAVITYEEGGSHIMVRNVIDVVNSIRNVLEAFFSVELILIIVMLLVFIMGVAFMVFVSDQCCQHRERSVFRNDVKRGLPKAFTWTAMALAKKEVDRPATACTYIWLFLLTAFHFMIFALLLSATNQVVEKSGTELSIKNFADLHGKQVGTVLNTVPYNSLLRDSPGSKIAAYDTVDEMFNAFSAPDSTLDALYFDSPVLIDARVKDSRLDGTTIVGELRDKAGLGFPIPNDRNDIQEKMSIALAHVKKSGDLKKFQDLWFSKGITDLEENDEVQSTLWIIGVMAAIIFVIALISFMILKYFKMRRLKKFKAKKESERRLDGEKKGEVDANVGLGEYLASLFVKSKEEQAIEDEYDQEEKRLEAEGRDIRFITEYDMPFHLAREFHSLKCRYNDLARAMQQLLDYIVGREEVVDGTVTETAVTVLTGDEVDDLGAVGTEGPPVAATVASVPRVTAAPHIPRPPTHILDGTGPPNRQHSAREIKIPTFTYPVMPKKMPQ